MGVFSVKGSDQFDQRIQADLDEIVAEVQALPESKDFQAVILMGGYGRGEGTPFITQGKQEPFNDYDLIVVGHDVAPWKRRDLRSCLHAAEHRLSARLNLPVDLYFHTQSAMKQAEFSLMNYELRNGHRVVWGPCDILNLMPIYSVDQLPKSEGTRLLLNRGTLLLMLRDAHASLAQLKDEHYLEAVKFLGKVFLALGDCILMAMGKYAVSYSVKREVIQSIEAPADLADFSWILKHYDLAISFREWGDPEMFRDFDLDALLAETCQVFERFLLWYEGQRLEVGLRTVEDYVEALTQDTFQEESSWKSFALNLLLLRQRSLQPGRQWLLHHPRYRLFPALLLLLKEENCDLASSLLGGADEWGTLRREFFRLRERLS